MPQPRPRRKSPCWPHRRARHGPGARVRRAAPFCPAGPPAATSTTRGWVHARGAAPALAGSRPWPKPRRPDARTATRGEPENPARLPASGGVVATALPAGREGPSDFFAPPRHPARRRVFCRQENAGTTARPSAKPAVSGSRPAAGGSPARPGSFAACRWPSAGPARLERRFAAPSRRLDRPPAPNKLRQKPRLYWPLFRPPQGARPAGHATPMADCPGAGAGTPVAWRRLWPGHRGATVPAERWLPQGARRAPAAWPPCQ